MKCIFLKTDEKIQGKKSKEKRSKHAWGNTYTHINIIFKLVIWIILVADLVMATQPFSHSPSSYMTRKEKKMTKLLDWQGQRDNLPFTVTIGKNRLNMGKIIIYIQLEIDQRETERKHKSTLHFFPGSSLYFKMFYFLISPWKV